MKIFLAIYHTIKFWTLIVFLSIVLGIATIVAGIIDRSGNRAHQIARLWCRLNCTLNGIKVEIEGLDNIHSDRAQIFVANHQSYFDIFAISGYLPVQLRWLAKSSLFRIPFVGWSMRAAGYIAVDRSNRKKAYQSFLKTTEKITSGYSVVIFPEGTRSQDGTIGPFKKGSHLLALRAKTPMVPITIIGSGAIIKKRSVVIRPGPVRIIISPAVGTESLTNLNGEEALKKIRNTICSVYENNLKTR